MSDLLASENAHDRVETEMPMNDGGFGAGQNTGRNRTHRMLNPKDGGSPDAAVDDKDIRIDLNEIKDEVI